MNRTTRLGPPRSASFRALLLALIVCSPAESGEESAWRRVRIPDAWRVPPGGELATRDGWAWYRCRVRVPGTWRGRELVLFVESVDDARESRLNGLLVGASGSLPPRFRSGLGEPGRHVLPADAIRFGEVNVVAVRTHTLDGRTNFRVAPPALVAGDEGVRLEGDWEYMSHDVAPGAELVAPESAPLYERVDAVADLEAYIRRRADDSPRLSPQESWKRFEVPGDLRIDLVLSEPRVRQPLFIDFDERGRLWVLQYLQYPDPAGLRPVSRDKHLRTVYEGEMRPPPDHVRGADRITIHEDTDGDGSLDSDKVFLDGLNLATSFARGRGGVWVLDPPHLVFWPDRDGDDVPDGAPEVHLEGFGLEDTHSVVNSLRVGPDGWLYATQGSTVSGQVRRHGSTEPPKHSMGQLVWRYHPDDGRYEVFAEGGGNAFGLEVDSLGRMFSGHNGGDTRGFHYVQGGYYRKGFGKHGALSNPHAFGFFEAMEHHRVPRFTHTFVVYEDEVLPESCRGRLFGVEPLQGQVVRSEIEPRGSTFRTRDIDRVVRTDDRWFRPVDIKVGPDGAIWIADFHEQDIDHSSHYAGRIAKDTGRIWRLAPREGSVVKSPDLSAVSSEALVSRLDDPARRVRRLALRLLRDRGDRSVVPALRERLAVSRGRAALGALQALEALQAFDDALVLDGLRHPTAAVRAWTARLVGDGAKEPTEEVARALARAAREDGSVEVRSQLASTARRLSPAQALPVLTALARRSEDLDDPHLPLLLWWGFEAQVSRDVAQAVRALEAEELRRRPIVARWITGRLARRLAAEGSPEALRWCAVLLRTAPDDQDRRRILDGVDEAWRGRPAVLLPDELAAAIEAAGGGSTELRLRRGAPEAVAAAVDTLLDERADPNARVRLVRTLGELRRDELTDPLTRIVAAEGTPDELRAAAIAALEPLDATGACGVILDRVDRLGDEAREAAWIFLTSRPDRVRALLDRVDSGRIEPETIPDGAWRRASAHDDESLGRRLRARIGPELAERSSRLRARIDALVAQLSEGAGNPYAGRETWKGNCARCHRLFDEGGDIGPDLTSDPRDDARRLLTSIVDPSAEIREGYETSLVVTRDGRAVDGFLVSEDGRALVLRGVDGRNRVVMKDEVVSRRRLDRSIMPEGLLDRLDPQALRDLLAYLRSSQPLP